jgi:N-acetylneuraminic acid mutarotase
MSFHPIRQYLLGLACLLSPMWLVTSASAQASGPKLHWKLEDPLSSSRYALAATTAPDGSIYVIGGASVATVLDIVDIIQPHGHGSLSGPPLPFPRYRHTAVTGGDGRIYAIGGSNPGGVGGAVLNSVVALTPGAQQWVSVAPMPTGRQLLGASTGLDGRLYVLGGADDLNVFNTLEIYNPVIGQWTAGAPMPTPRYGLAVATAQDGRIFAIGGMPQGVFQILDVVEAYTPTTNSWTTVAPIPPPLRALANAATGPDGRIYLIGGCELVITPSGPDCVDSNRVDAYTPWTNSWEMVEPTLLVHREGAVAVSMTHIFAISGHTTAVESGK